VCRIPWRWFGILRATSNFAIRFAQVLGAERARDGGGAAVAQAVADGRRRRAR
jgi:hypothetical protein